MVTVIRVMISWVVSVILPNSNLKQLRDALTGASGRFAKRKSVKFGPKSSFDVVDDAVDVSLDGVDFVGADDDGF